jgi:hypothetical protein
MAHRKPLGSTCFTVADWHYELPELHDALRTVAGTWYRIVGVEAKATPARVGLMLERVAGQEPSADGVVTWSDGFAGLVHEFEWYARHRRAA